MTQVKHPPLLSCRGVSVDYVTAAGEARACNRVSLDIHPGETLGLAGESGCGKSTLAFAITRMHNPPALTLMTLASTLIPSPAERITSPEAGTRMCSL